jgi:hypothetical protein
MTNKYNDIFDAEKELAVKINAFYTAYKNYSKCNSTSSCITTDNTGSQIDALITAKNQLNDAIDNINTKIYDFKNGERDTKTTTDYNSNYKTILETHAINTKLRSELDEKLKTINNVKNSYSDIYANQYNATIYTGILWSILATTMIYYVFVKL